MSQFAHESPCPARSVVLLIACGGGGGGGDDAPLTFEGDWAGTWNLSPSENGTTTLTILFTNNNVSHIIQNAVLTNSGGPPHSLLTCETDLAGAVVNQSGTYQRGSDPTISVTGGQLALSNNGQTITGTVQIGGTTDIQFNLIRQ